MTDAIVAMLGRAQHWIAHTPHGDNCFVSSHYEGDPGDQCNCGKSSLEDAIHELLIEHESALPTPAPTMVDSEYPPLPEPAIKSTQCDSTMRYTTIHTFSSDQMRAYVDADRATRPTLQSLGGDAGVSEPVALRNALSRLERAVDLHLGRSLWTQSMTLKGLAYSVEVRKELFAAHDEARAALTSTQKSDGWMPIEQAPKDGTELLLTNGEAVQQGWWMEREGGIKEHRDTDGRYLGQDEDEGYIGWWDASGGMQPEPTHYQSLPAAPKAAEKSGRSE